MKYIKTFEIGERVRLEYVITEKTMKDGEIYYKLKNAIDQSILRGVAFTADELIPVETEGEDVDEDDGK